MTFTTPEPKAPKEDHQDLSAFLEAARAAFGDARFRLPELVYLFSMMKRLAPSRRKGVDARALSVWLDRHRGLAPGKYALVASKGRVSWTVTETASMNDALDDALDSRALDAELDALLRS